MKYIDEEDLSSKKVRIVPEAERALDRLNDPGPDAEDLAVLRRKPVGRSDERIVSILIYLPFFAVSY